MRMHEAGLVQHWYKEKLPKVEECFRSSKDKRDESMEGRELLSLKGLTGSFIFFIAGTLVSIIVLLIETGFLKLVYFTYVCELVYSQSTFIRC